MHDQVMLLAGCGDDELVLRAQASDDAAFGELMRRTSASSLRLAMSILRDRAEAEDEVQNSYLRAWRHLGQFQRESKFSTWISRIVLNHCLMRLRKLRGANFVFIDDTGAGAEETKRPTEIRRWLLLTRGRARGPGVIRASAAGNRSPAADSAASASSCATSMSCPPKKRRVGSASPLLP